MDWKHGYTDEEIAEAEKPYRADCEKMYKEGYGGDFGCGLGFVMATYGPMCWQYYFKRPPPDGTPLFTMGELDAGLQALGLD